MAADGPYDRELQKMHEDLETRTKKEKDLQQTLQSDIRRYKRVGVVVGLLCGVLALLNIAVPLYLYRSNMVKTDQLQISFDKLEARLKLLTEERDQLQINTNNLTNERDDMKRIICESSGWQTFDGGLYYISTEKKNWTESRQWCRDRQSDLIVIKSKDEQDFVKRFDKRVWLGLTDRQVEGIFLWVDGTALTTPTYWTPGNPDNSGGEDCVEFYDGSDSGAREKGWNDNLCHRTNYWICEKAMC